METEDNLPWGVAWSVLCRLAEDVKTVLWTTLYLLAPLGFALLVASQVSGEMPIARFGGESRWSDLGALPIWAMLLQVVTLEEHEESPWWRGAGGGWLVAFTASLIWGAELGLLLFVMWLVGMLTLRIALPIIRWFAQTMSEYTTEKRIKEFLRAYLESWRAFEDSCWEH